MNFEQMFKFTNMQIFMNQHWPKNLVVDEVNGKYRFVNTDTRKNKEYPLTIRSLKPKEMLKLIEELKVELKL